MSLLGDPTTPLAPKDVGVLVWSPNTSRTNLGILLGHYSDHKEWEGETTPPYNLFGNLFGWLH